MNLNEVLHFFKLWIPRYNDRLMFHSRGESKAAGIRNAIFRLVFGRLEWVDERERTFAFFPCLCYFDTQSASIHFIRHGDYCLAMAGLFIESDLQGQGFGFVRTAADFAGGILAAGKLERRNGSGWEIGREGYEHGREDR